eukprot:5969302-Amphidinium_carterae.1
MHKGCWSQSETSFTPDNRHSAARTSFVTTLKDENVTIALLDIFAHSELLETLRVTHCSCDPRPPAATDFGCSNARGAHPVEAATVSFPHNASFTAKYCT